MYRSYFNLTYYSKILLTDLDSKTVIVPIPWALLRQQDFLNPVLFSMTLIFKKKKNLRGKFSPRYEFAYCFYKTVLNIFSADRYT